MDSIRVRIEAGSHRKWKGIRASGNSEQLFAKTPLASMEEVKPFSRNLSDVLEMEEKIQGLMASTLMWEM